MPLAEMAHPPTRALEGRMDYDSAAQSHSRFTWLACGDMFDVCKEGSRNSNWMFSRK